MLTVRDRLEIRLLELFLQRRAEHPTEPLVQSYAEVYGEIVFEDRADPEEKP